MTTVDIYKRFPATESIDGINQPGIAQADKHDSQQEQKKIHIRSV